MERVLKRAWVAIPFWAALACPCVAAGSAEDATTPPKPEVRILTFDLATQGEKVLRVTPGTYKVVLASAAPRADYVVAQESVQLVVPPLAPPLGSMALFVEGEKPRSPACTAALTKLAQENLSEKDVLATLAAATNVPGCADSDDYKTLSARTRIEVGPIAVGEGEDLEITVRRTMPSEDGTGTSGKKAIEKKWVFTLTTVGRGAWLMSYGFSFAPNDDRGYYSKATGTSGKYVITAKSDPDALSYIPSVFFSWYSRKSLRRTWSWGPSGGVGFDQTRPSVFLGLRGSHSQNLSLIAGAVIRPVTRLAGEYTEGQEVSENLTPDKLVETGYRPTYFAALTFRFGSNPFTSAPAAGTPAKPAKPEPGK